MPSCRVATFGRHCGRAGEFAKLLGVVSCNGMFMLFCAWQLGAAFQFQSILACRELILDAFDRLSRET